VKPVTGFFDLTSKATEGIKETTFMFDKNKNKKR